MLFRSVFYIGLPLFSAGVFLFGKKANESRKMSALYKIGLVLSAGPFIYGCLIGLFFLFIQAGGGWHI